MILKPCYTFAFLLNLTLYHIIPAQKMVNFDWSVYDEIPSDVINIKHSGLAGAFSGVIKNVLILAGGANFPDKMPWEEGIKKYHRDVYLLPLSDQKHEQWINIKLKFPIPIAYGASVVYKNRLICIGGENEDGPTDKIWEVTLNSEGDDIIVKTLTQLPLPLTNLSASVIGHTLYIAGGETNSKVSKTLFSLDLNQIQKGFKLEKEIPMPISHSLLLSSSVKSDGELYLIGGRKKNVNGISTLYSTVFNYNIKKDTWTTKADLPHPISALTGIKFANNQFIILGGDKGETFSKIEHYLSSISTEINIDKKQELVRLKNQLQINHPGFSKEILAYDIKMNRWTKIGIFPYEVPVTTTALLWNKSIILPSGEIKAGVRTPKIVLGKLKKK